MTSFKLKWLLKLHTKSSRNRRGTTKLRNEQKEKGSTAPLKLSTLKLLALLKLNRLRPHTASMLTMRFSYRKFITRDKVLIENSFLKWTMSRSTPRISLMSFRTSSRATRGGFNDTWGQLKKRQEKMPVAKMILRGNRRKETKT